MVSMIHRVQRRIQCAVGGQHGRRIRDVQPTSVPGLVIVDLRSHYHDTIYSVTHQRSGLRVGDYCATIDEARDLAEALGFWTKECPGFWTLSADEMGTLSGMVSHIRRQLGKDERTL